MQKIHWFRFVRRAISAVAGAAALAFSVAPAMAQDTFAVGMVPADITSLAPRFAEAAGTYATYKIKPELVTIEGGSRGVQVLLAGKLQGTIVDFLMPPLSTGELIAGLIGGAITRAFCVGAAVWLAMQFWPGVSVMPKHPWAVLWFGFMGSMMLSWIGLLTSIWAEKFDHNAMITNFVIAPLTLLSGTFYSVDRLAPAFQAISHANPFFYVISGFRYGFLGVADSSIALGSAVMVGINVVLGVASYLLLRSGWRIKS